MSDLLSRVETKLREDSQREYNALFDDVKSMILKRTKANGVDSEDQTFIKAILKLFDGYEKRALDRMQSAKMRDFIGNVCKFETLIKAFEEG